MKVTNEKTENCQAFLTIEMEPPEMEESSEEAYHELVKKVSIPGFRKGKAPRAILERHVSKERLLDETIDHLLPKAYEKALKEQGIEAIARPTIEIVQTEPLKFKVVIPLKPVIKLGDYHSLRLTPEPAEVTEDDINRAIEQLRHRHATWEPVDRPVGFHDLVVFDIESNIEGKPLVNQKGVQYQVIHESTFPAPGFADQLIEMKKGEEKEFELEFPADYPRSNLAGKKPSFKVKVTEIKQEVLPELNDDFARMVNPEFQTLGTLSERVATDLKQIAEEKNRIDFEDKVIEEVVKSSQVEFPPILVESEIDYIINQQARQWQINNLEEYLRSVNKTEQELRDELRPSATKRVTQSLVLGKVAEEEKSEVADAEIDAEIERMIKDVTKKEGMRKILNTPSSRDSIKHSLVTRETIQRLTEIAKGETAKKD